MTNENGHIDEVKEEMTWYSLQNKQRRDPPPREEGTF